MKAAGAFEGLPRELRIRHNMGTIYCENRNGQSENVIFRTAYLLSRPDTRLLGPGWFSITWPFLLARRSIKMPPFRFPD